MRSADTNDSATCAFSPFFVERFVASAATSASAVRKVEPSSTAVSAPSAIEAFAIVTVHGASGVAGFVLERSNQG